MSGNQPLLLFDVDGVVLQEVGYYRTLAITCAHFYEALCETVGVEPLPKLRSIVNSMEEVDLLREAFLPSTLLDILRSRALNSNWDKTYAVVLALNSLPREVIASAAMPLSLHAVLSEKSGSASEYLRQLEQMVKVSDRHLFERVYEVFQQVHIGPWPTIPFLVDGMIQFDEPTVDKNRLIDTLSTLQSRGYLMGIGTGRPWEELKIPFEALGLLRFFQPDRIVTIDEVKRAEEQHGLAPFSLAKPHPYTYLRGATNYTTEGVYVIGDSPSDQLAANEAGFEFIGVGHAETFSNALKKPFAIIDNVLQIPNVLVDNGR